ncbi:hypothetical protein LTR37_017087 [Vermiconidia calcicola]|uniref:Uncharacterized protein n=1 Tax=Vermiconidia calcicola TaxID=1690605 RepID=A0ACC3MLB5_9PEZI|nr:hypothetical protein LTR37_017087 [Vermiconidia calcicola]
MSKAEEESLDEGGSCNAFFIRRHITSGASMPYAFPLDSTTVLIPSVAPESSVEISAVNNKEPREEQSSDIPAKHGVAPHEAITAKRFDSDISAFSSAPRTLTSGTYQHQGSFARYADNVSPFSQLPAPAPSTPLFPFPKFRRSERIRKLATASVASCAGPPNDAKGVKRGHRNISGGDGDRPSFGQPAQDHLPEHDQNQPTKRTKIV